ncbi:hypothetical protein [Parvibaculum sp.]|uniref:hypothetical protein n=1 Tax=Parvibaculum sp. TaxID=2024848 RepID=UPI003BA881ED
MSRLVVVSNRVGPVKDAARAGGLAVALVDALKARGGLWYGWSGKVDETWPGSGEDRECRQPLACDRRPQHRRA